MRHSKVASVKPEALKNVRDIMIIDEAQYRETLENHYKEKIHGRLYDWLKEKNGYVVMEFATSFHDPDPDFKNWYYVIDSHVEALMIVNRA